MHAWVDTSAFTLGPEFRFDSRNVVGTKLAIPRVPKISRDLSRTWQWQGGY